MQSKIKSIRKSFLKHGIKNSSKIGLTHYFFNYGSSLWKFHHGFKQSPIKDGPYNLGQELNCASPQRSLSIDNLHLLAFVEIRLFNVFFLEKKNEIRYSDGKSAGCGILVKKGRECGIRASHPDPYSMYPTSLRSKRFCAVREQRIKGR